MIVTDGISRFQVKGSESTWTQIHKRRAAVGVETYVVVPIVYTKGRNLHRIAHGQFIATPRRHAARGLQAVHVSQGDDAGHLTTTGTHANPSEACRRSINGPSTNQGAVSAHHGRLPHLRAAPHGYHALLPENAYQPDLCARLDQ